MLHLTKLRDLNLRAGTSPERPGFLSAASGLVRAGEWLYVVADDELHLGVFSRERNTPGELLRLFPGELPGGQKKRKQRKPDLEVLTRLPPFAGCPHDALLALGSGSARSRCRGALLTLNGPGRIQGAPRMLDASALFAGLERQFDALNLEGAWVSGHGLHLLQRGNKGNSPNAVIHLDLGDFLSALMAGDVLPALKPLGMQTMELGAVTGVPLCFTDAAVLPDGRCLFSAVAEDTDSAYADGACVGAAIGMMDAHHQLLWMEMVAPACKIEGIDVCLQAGQMQILLVTDADDSQVPAYLLSTVV